MYSTSFVRCQSKKDFRIYVLQTRKTYCSRQRRKPVAVCGEVSELIQASQLELNPTVFEPCSGVCFEVVMHPTTRGTFCARKMPTGTFCLHQNSSQMSNFSHNFVCRCLCAGRCEGGAPADCDRRQTDGWDALCHSARGRARPREVLARGK